ncbi:sigma-70 family RNA polymerase sigma factor [Chitinophaga agrisoli]|uniref:Sigma-70 family RNA polymerase sigma factor n=1 Tax=Chitinophaga agrisoli TaxID=2607653 RepID=A0A5B2VPT3_9BACT|nr:sigma-70 family RNA polymerase sigma factor [Chitinophaga agrisoli]KAA2240688.1 sigma-70 family RNA polymerase sigma factor [Chitinophaga agrisoli]
MDKNLIEEVKGNNEAAFTTIYNQYHAKLYYYFLNKTRSEAISADLVQTTFLKCWKYRNHLNPDIALSHQIFRIAKTTLIDLLRQKAKEKLLSLDEYAAADNIPEAPPVSRSFVEEVRVTLNKIPPQRGKIMQLRLKGWTNQEIAEQLGISKRTVENQLNKAIKEIRSLISTDIAIWILLYGYYTGWIA